MVKSRSVSGKGRRNAAASRNNQAKQGGSGRTRVLLRGSVAVGLMNATSVVIVPELFQLPGQVHGILEEDLVEVLAPDCLNEPFDERR